MALPPSGAISLSQIQTEFGGANPISLSEYYRGGGLTTPNNTGVPTSGTISLSNFYGAVKQFEFAVSSNQTNANLRTLAVSAGWDQSSPVICTINDGVYISSNSTGTPALTVNGSFPSGVQVINNGIVVGMGGAGGNGRSSGSFNEMNNTCSSSGGSAGSAGGLALSVSVAVSINNAGTIAGGGGGGGGGAGRCNPGVFVFESGLFEGGSYDLGGGGGGGRSSAAANSVGGARGVQIGTTDGNPGTVSAAGTGGQYGPGGTGGNWGEAGGSGGLGGGAAGAAVSGNANITWIAFGTRLGAVA